MEKIQKYFDLLHDAGVCRAERIQADSIVLRHGRSINADMVVIFMEKALAALLTRLRGRRRKRSSTVMISGYCSILMTIVGRGLRLLRWNWPGWHFWMDTIKQSLSVAGPVGFARNAVWIIAGFPKRQYRPWRGVV